jgi:hypothetical protein
MRGVQTNGTAAAASASGRPGWGYRLQLLYVRIMLWLVGRLLQAASGVDPVIRAEVAALPRDFSFAMRLHSGAAALVMRRDGDRLRAVPAEPGAGYSLTFEFKHVTHAFLVLGFVEGTARAFANDRMTMGGDVALAMKIVRCLNRMESLVLPKFVAARAVKAYPSIGLGEKLGLAAKIYGRLVIELFGG